MVEPTLVSAVGLIPVDPVDVPPDVVPEEEEDVCAKITPLASTERPIVRKLFIIRIVLRAGRASQVFPEADTGTSAIISSCHPTVPLSVAY